MKARCSTRPRRDRYEKSDEVRYSKTCLHGVNYWSSGVSTCCGKGLAPKGPAVHHLLALYQGFMEFARVDSVPTCAHVLEGFWMLWI